MFCKNCGNQILDGDKFCGICGHQQSGGSSTGGETFTQSKIVDTGLIKLFKNYFIKPVSFFSELKGEDLLKSSIALLLGLPIIYGLINILYTSALVSSIFSEIRKLPEILADAKIISQQEAVKASQEFMMSNEMINMKSKINGLIDNKDIFLSGAGQIFVLIILTAVILAILNALVLKSKMRPVDVFFISTASYIPLVISIVLGSLATFISIVFGLLILLSGYVLSFITLYCGIKQMSEEKSDKVFMVMIILFAVCSALLSIFIIKRIESSLISTMSIFDTFKGIL